MILNPILRRNFCASSPLRDLLRRNFTSNEVLKTDSALHGARLTGSAKLLADAAREESEAEDSQPSKSTQVSLLENQHENWTGDERMEDTVLRMLVDKYKPLRSGSIRTAEQKLKQAPPRVLDSLEPRSSGDRDSFSGSLEQAFSTPSTGSWSTEPLLPSKEGHRPWHTEYKVPSHVTSSVKLARFPPPASARSNAHSVDDRARKKELDVKKRFENAGRLTRARESTLDYRLGLNKAASARAAGGRPNPVSLKGWTSLIEDKIEVSLGVRSYLEFFSTYQDFDMARKLGWLGLSIRSRAEVNPWCITTKRATLSSDARSS